MIQVPALGQEKVWLEKFKYDQAEKKFYEKLAKSQSQPTNKASNKQQQPQQQSSKKAAQISTTSKVDSKASGNKSNKTVKEQISVQPTPVVPQPTPSSTTAQPAKKTGEGNEAVTGNLTHESSGFFENEVSSTKSNKNIRTYKKEKEKKLTEEIFSSVTPATINPPAFQSQDIITPGPTPTPSDPSLITNKEHKKKKAKKERLRNPSKESKVTSVNNSLASEVAKARHHIKTSLQCIDDIADIATTAAVDEISVKVGALEKENSDLKHKVASLTDLVAKMEIRLNKLESGGKVTTSTSSQVPLVTGKPAPSKPQNNDDDDDDGVDLFGSDSDEDDAEAAKIKEQRLAEYAAKKSKKPALIAKSNIILDVKPWDDETDMKKMEQEVRKIEMDGLIWGASKLVPLAYGIHKLQISCVVEDDKVSVDLLQETMEAIGDYVQSVDIAAFNKV